MFCEIYLQSAAHIITIYDLLIYLFIYLFYFQVLFNGSSIPDCSIPDSSILDPDFPVNHDVLLIKIILFSRPLKWSLVPK